MTAPSESPYVTRDELAARIAEFEVRIIDRIAALERRLDDHFRAQTRYILTLLLPLYGLLILGLGGMALAILNSRG